MTRVTDVGLLPFSLHLGDGADAGTVLLERGGISVVNGDLHVGRRRLTLAHELGHFLVADPYTTDWRVATDGDAIESRFDRFARALLIPAADLAERWREWCAVPDESIRDAAVRGASHYRVDMTTLARRLHETGAANSSEVQIVRSTRTLRADIVEKDLLVHDELEPVSLPRSYQISVLALYRSETISMARAIDLLLGTFDEDSMPELPTRPEHEIWDVTS